MAAIRQKDELDTIIDELVDLKDDLSAKIDELENLEFDKLEEICTDDLAKILKDRLSNNTVIIENLNMAQYDKLLEFVHTEIWPTYGDQLKHIL